MNVLEWAKRHPDQAERIAPIAAATRLDHLDYQAEQFVERFAPVHADLFSR